MWRWIKKWRAKEHGKRGNFHFAKSDWNKAIAAYDRALTLSDAWPYLLLKRGWAHFNARSFAQAASDATRYVDVASKSPTLRAAAFNLRAQCRFMTQESPAALSDISESIRLHPHPNYCFVRAAILAKLNRRQEMKRDLQSLIASAPEHWHGMMALARLLASANDPQERNGLEALRLALRANELTAGKNWKVLSVVAAAHAECGSFAQAVEWAERTLSLTPEREKKTRQERLDQYRQGIPFREDSPLEEGPASPGDHADQPATS